MNTFEEERKESLLGFCVMGGIFFRRKLIWTEDKLIGAVIVGTGSPQVCREREILKDYLISTAGTTMLICIRMNKVLQAAGRVIRTDETEEDIVAG